MGDSLTIESAIKHAEEIAKEQDELCKRYDDASRYYRSHNEDIVSANAKKCRECFECAKEHRQLAEWLKDYKRLLEQEPIIKGYCKDCKWQKDGDGVFRRGIDAESKCPMNRIEVFEGNGYCFLYEPKMQAESEADNGTC